LSQAIAEFLIIPQAFLSMDNSHNLKNCFTTTVLQKMSID